MRNRFDSNDGKYIEEGEAAQAIGSRLRGSIVFSADPDF